MTVPSEHSLGRRRAEKGDRRWAKDKQQIAQARGGVANTLFFCSLAVEGALMRQSLLFSHCSCFGGQGMGGVVNWKSAFRTALGSVRALKREFFLSPFCVAPCLSDFRPWQK